MGIQSNSLKGNSISSKFVLQRNTIVTNTRIHTCLWEGGNTFSLKEKETCL